MDYQETIIEHYKKNWGDKPNIHFWDKGPSNELPYSYRVLEFAPNDQRQMWTYATCCMSQPEDDAMIELHIFSSEKDTSLVELLTAVAYYHRMTKRLGLNHTVNFGCPWQDESLCDYGYISLPFLDGPELECMAWENRTLHNYWLIPITKKEMEYKAKFGYEALEEKFETKGFNYLNPNRESLV